MPHLLGHGTTNHENRARLTLNSIFELKEGLMKELGTWPRQTAFLEAGLPIQDIIELKGAEEKLMESEEKFRRVFQEGPLGMCIATADFRFSRVNNAFCRMLGYSSRELALLTFKDITHPEHLTQDIESVNKLIAGEIPFYRTEKRYLRKDGKTIWAASTITVMKDPAGQVLFFLSFVEDITLHQQTEEALRESEQRYRLLVDSSLDGVLLTNPEGDVLSANPAACQILGYTEEEIRNLGRWGIVDASDPNLPAALEERAKTGKFRGELTLIRKDGTKFPAEISSAVFRKKDGRDRTSMIIRDITKQKWVVERLRKSEERYRTIIETLEDGYYEMDLTGNLTYCNDILAQIHEYPRAKLLGMNNRRYTDQENGKILFKAFNRVYRTGEPSKGTTYEIITEGGGRKNLEASISLIRDSSGKAIGFRGIVRDVTELRQTQRALQESENRYRDLVESSRDLISIHDLNGQILWLNEEPIRILGFERDLLLKMNIRDLVTLEHKEEFDNYLAAIKSQGIAKGLMTLQTAKGEKRVWEYHNTLRTQGVAEPIVRSMARDVTERVQAEKEAQDTLQKLRKAMNGTIQAMALTIETRDPYTAGHQQRVADLARAIAQVMNLTEDQVDALRMAGIVHDLGKIGIPAEILSKPIELTDIEFQLIKIHPQISYNILKDIDFPWPVARIVLQHHERINGSGYPFGLSGEDILLESRILAVADVVEAIASHRPYRPAHGIDKALEEISTNKGILYDPEAVDSCIRLFYEKGYTLKKQTTFTSFSA
jgi:PAS domain S-box-containing protein